MGLLIPSEYGLVLATPASDADLTEAVMKAATIEPPFHQRRTTYRKAPGVGTMRLDALNADAAARTPGYVGPPALAMRASLGELTVYILIDTVGRGAEARYVCVGIPTESGSDAAADGLPWVTALARRTAVFLGFAGIRGHTIDVLAAVR